MSRRLKELNMQRQKYSVILTPMIKGKIAVPENAQFSATTLKNVDYVFSIGGAFEHNIAKEALSKNGGRTKPQLVTVPISLSNDSFCTNRSSLCFDRIEVASRETLYPSEIMIDFEILENIDQRLNVLGFGEVVGLYYSVRDYFLVKRLPKVDALITKIEEGTRKLMLSFAVKRHIWLKHLAMNLLAKCLIMRLAKDNQIGAGGDHLIAYALEYIHRNAKRFDYRLSHGESVYLGSLCLAALFPEWEYGFFTLENLVNLGKAFGILNSINLDLLAKTLKNGLIPLATSMRPGRQTVLSILTKNEVKNGWKRLCVYLK